MMEDTNKQIKQLDDNVRQLESRVAVAENIGSDIREIKKTVYTVKWISFIILAAVIIILGSY